MPIASPEIAVILIALGALSVTAEFCLPGKVVPGVAGAVLLTVGTASLLSPAAPFPLILAAALWFPVAAVIFWLLKMAVRARRNKLRVS